MIAQLVCADRTTEVMGDAFQAGVDHENQEVMISRERFNSWLTQQPMLSMLEECQIETSTKFELFDALDVDMGGTLGIDELVGGLMRLRGPMTKSDVVATRLKVRHMIIMIEDIWTKLHGDRDSIGMEGERFTEVPNLSP